MKFKINPEARKAVYARSGGNCETPDCTWDDVFPGCGLRREAVHLHHLTYERAGHELPEDLLHICVFCHMKMHPEKDIKIFCWELHRQYEMRRSRMTAEERAEEDYREEQREEEYEREMEERNSPALNLGNYTASGYCIEDVEAEEAFRRTRLGIVSREKSA